MYGSCKVIERDCPTDGLVRLTLAAPELAAQARPGQFVMLRSWDGPQPYLPRPISLNRIDPARGEIGFLIRVKGLGTQLLSLCGQGDTVQAHGPLGNGFPLPSRGGRVALVGRGVGAAPLRPLAEACAARGCEISVYLSARSEALLPDLAFYESLGAALTVSTDENQKVTQQLASDCRETPFTAAYSCGSTRLARDVRLLQKEYGFAAFISLEAGMACGVGACKGCAVRAVSDGGAPAYLRVCRDGPVFPLERIVE